jgi:hypothetical protein
MKLSIRLIVKRKKFNRYELLTGSYLLDEDIFDFLGFAVLKAHLIIKPSYEL